MKLLLKQIVNLLAGLIVFPLVPLYWLSTICLGKQVAFPGWSQALSLLPGISGVYIRKAFYKWILDECGDDVWIGFGTTFSHSTVTIGQSAYIGVYCMIGDVEIQEDVLIGSHASIINGNQQHRIDKLDLPVREQGGQFPRVIIGSDSWIGDRAIVMFDLGKSTVIGAGAVVTKPVADYEIVVGNPAKVVARRDEIAAQASHSLAGQASKHRESQDGE